MLEGLIVIMVEPEPDTNPPATLIVSTVELSDDFLINIFPLSASTASENVKTILSFTPTLVAPSLGEEEDRVGAVLINSKPVVNVYSSTLCVPRGAVLSVINIFVPSLLKVMPVG